jgi:hypothetical protein
MNKSRTAKILSAAAVANLAAVGFAASPATASTRPVATTGAAAASAAGGPHPGITFISSGSVRTAGPAAKPRGFVPRASTTIRPDTESGLNGYVYLTLVGGGSYVSYVYMTNEGTGCHIPWISVNEPVGGSVKYTGGYYCAGGTFEVAFDAYYPVGTDFCGHFQNVTGQVCEPVR